MKKAAELLAVPINAKREQRLPSVLSTDEVRKILGAVRTSQNSAYPTTVYACGLRLNEALNLQVSDIDSGRMRIHVHRGKGAKDRYVPLPEATLLILHNYWKSHSGFSQASAEAARRARRLQRQ